MTPSISVALCTHNGARFIEEQIRSILEQTTPVDEIVISDDASTDGTVEIIKRVVARAGGKSPGLVVIENAPALGVVKNFEQAMAACTGEIIVLCDQDDIWHPDRVRRAVEVLTTTPATLVFSDARLVDESGTFLGHTLFEALEIGVGEKEAIAAGHAFEQLVRRNLVTGATTAVTANLFEVARPFPTGWIHDEWLATIAAATADIALINEPLIDYRQHGSNQIGVRKLGPLGKLRRLVEESSERNQFLFLRAEELLARLEPTSAPPRVGVSRERVQLARAKVAHHARRMAFPARRLKRISPVYREWRSGDYLRFGRGTAEAVRDLIQPEKR